MNMTFDTRKKIYVLERSNSRLARALLGSCSECSGSLTAYF